MTPIHRKRLLHFLLWLALICLSGCAVYHREPLPAAPDLAAVPFITVPASEFWLPGLNPRPFPKDGLDETAVVTLAVFDNPELKAARMQAGVASAQVLQAGLLPDPQLNADFAKSVLNYGGDIGLIEDIQSLITRGAAKTEAKERQKQVYLNILWQEWQVAEKARELFIQSRADAQLQQVLVSTRDFLSERYGQDLAAMERGDATLSTITADLALLTNAESKLRQFQVSASLTSHRLNELLGLQPSVPLHLIGSTAARPLSQQDFEAAVAALPHRRADLLALRAGYQAQEERVRQAILAQFPNLSAGVVYSRDPVEGVNDFGPNVTLSLPVFNRNRGQIAMQRATRAALRQAYQARLDQAVGEADQVWSATKILQSELRDLDVRLAALEKTAAAARQSFQEENLSAGLYVSVETGLLNTQAEEIQLRGSFRSAQSALETLLGLPFQRPAVDP